MPLKNLQVTVFVTFITLIVFWQVGFSSRKVNRHVDFPFVLDLAPFCSSLCQVSDVVNTSTSTLEIVTVKLHSFIMIVKCYTDQKKKTSEDSRQLSK